MSFVFFMDGSTNFLHWNLTDIPRSVLKKLPSWALTDGHFGLKSDVTVTEKT